MGLECLDVFRGVSRGLERFRGVSMCLNGFKVI